VPLDAELLDQASLVPGRERHGALQGALPRGRQPQRMRAPVGARRQPPSEVATFEPVEQSNKPRPFNAEPVGEV